MWTRCRGAGGGSHKVFIPATVMDDLWDGALIFEEGRASPVNIDIRSSDTARADADNTRRRFKLAQLVQRLAPNLHRWNRSGCSPSTGCGPTSAGARIHPGRHGRPRVPLDGRRGLGPEPDLDFTFEDQIAAHVGS